MVTIADLLRSVVAGALFATLLSDVGQAQGADSALLRGEVAGPLRVPLGQVEVLVKDTANRVIATTRTDNDGMFLVQGLNHHTRYRVSIFRIGYVPDSITVVTSRVQDTSWFDVQLLAEIPKLDTVGAHSALLTGEVVDPLRVPLGQVEVLIKDTANRVVATTRTDSGGMFLMRGLAPHTQYHVLIRRIGYAPDTEVVVTPWVQETLRVNAKLLAVTPQLDTVNIAAKANRSSGLFGGLKRAFSTFQAHNLACGAEPASTATTPGFHWDWGLQGLPGLALGLFCPKVPPGPPPSTSAPATPSTPKDTASTTPNVRRQRVPALEALTHLVQL